MTKRKEKEVHLESIEQNGLSLCGSYCGDLFKDFMWKEEPNSAREIGL